MKNYKLSKLARKVLSIVNESNSPLTPTDLQVLLGDDIKIRSIRYAIRVLEEKNLIERQPDFTDLRSFSIRSKRSYKI